MENEETVAVKALNGKDSTRRFIERVNAVLPDPVKTKKDAMIQACLIVFEKSHDVMTVRQVYYQLVAQFSYENSLSSYKTFDDIVSRAREDESLPWDRFEERERGRGGRFEFGRRSEPDEIDVVNEISRAIQPSGHAEAGKWDGQDFLPVLIIEKNSLVTAVQRAASKLDCKYYCAKGFMPVQLLNEIRDLTEDHPDKIIRVYAATDFDPTGLEIVVSVTKWFEDNMDVDNVDVVRVGLNRDDAVRTGLPPAFAKPSDSRYAKFVEEYGDNTWELDALTTRDIENLYIKAVENDFDSEMAKKQELYRAMQDYEVQLKKKRFLRKAIRELRKDEILEQIFEDAGSDTRNRITHSLRKMNTLIVHSR